MNTTAPKLLRRRSVLHWGALAAEVATIALLIAGCSSGDPEKAEAPREQVSTTRQAVQGADGDRTVTAANTIVNQYTALTANAALAATQITVASAASLNPGGDPLAPGDLLLIIQMQGATINTAAPDEDSPTWGAVTALNNAGNYEFVEVQSVSGNTITLACALKKAFTAAGNVQVVRVPQYRNLTIASGSITAPDWNGTTGGIVAVRAENTITLNGNINVTGKGFRGGVAEDVSGDATLDWDDYAYSSNVGGAGKGESVAGYLTNVFGRGAPANGGGGGNAHNAAGGGGANAAKAGLPDWTGQGVMRSTVVGDEAWELDPGYLALNPDALTNSPGGGRGGYTYSEEDGDALDDGPGADAWQGNDRLERGGLGGRPLTSSPTTKLFFGGGGGSGDSNNGNQGVGGRGGGMVFLLAGTVAGTGSILANGAPGQNSNSTDAGLDNGDAPGGGGGGGTIIVRATTLLNFAISANGGVGGNQIIDNDDEAEGPGGGGGGGYVALSGTRTSLTVAANGALGGTTNATAVSEFPSNGATAGNDGIVDGDASTVSVCAGAAPNTSIPTTPTNPTNDATGGFVFASTVAGSTFECRIGMAAFATCAANYTTPALTDGTYTLQVQAVGPTGTKDPSPASFTWRVDTNPPETSFVTTESNPTSDSTAEFKFGSDEALSTYECRIDTAAFAPCPETYTTPALAAGSHTIQVRAKDQAGNIDSTPASYTWTYTPSVDADGDGIPNTAEETLGTDPDDADSDDDGVKDGDEPGFASDTDGDDLINALDPDSDNDGILDGTELGLTTPDADTNVSVGNFVPDADPATKTDPRKKDTDNGGLDDGAEDPNHDGKVDAGEKDPLNPADDTSSPPTDTDSDGLTDSEEADLGTDPNDADSDDDGVKDGDEPNPSVDSDGDGLINALDPDSDNDGIFDGTELGRTTPDAATNVSVGNFVPDADPGTQTNPLKKDTDNGGIDDGAEDTNHDGKIDAGEKNPNNPADDVTSPPTDTDNDGLTDDEEGELGTDPNDADSDDDGVSDGDEPNPSADTDGDGLRNPLDPDSDNDGLLDGTELGLGCTGAGTDPTKNHCIPDADSGATKTSPIDPDTDDGGVKDGSEDVNRDGKLDSGETDPTLGHGADDSTVVDTDGDGLSDGFEGNIGTDPNDKDSDDDGLLDGDEPNPSEDSDSDGLTNPLDVDSDNDGLFDGTELGRGCDDAATDQAQNHCRADADPTTTTGPLTWDTDGGTKSDGSEDHNLDGKKDATETDPTRGNGGDDTNVTDTDGDGLSDETETTIGSNPNDKDSDDDGLLDGEEPNPTADQDGDGKTGILDEDSDGDGLFDGTEAGKGCADAATDATKNTCIADADSGTTTTNVLDPDTDDGGETDGSEDSNKNGAVDTGERNPLDGSDDIPPSGAGGAGGTSAGGAAGAGGAPGTGGTSATTGGSGGQGGTTSSAGTTGAIDDSGTVVLGGGICSVSAPAAKSNARTSAWLVLAAAAALLSRRRRR